MSPKIENMTALIKDLSIAYVQLRDKKLDLKEAKEIANISGKLIKACAVQLDYNQYMQNGNKVDFLEK